MDSSVVDSVFEIDDPSSDDYAPEPKFAKATTKKAATAPKPKVVKSAPKKTNQTALKARKVAKKPTKSERDENSEVDLDSDDDASLLSHTPPSAKRQKKAPGTKLSSGKPLQPIANESYGLDGTDEVQSKKSSTKRTTGTDQYQRLTQTEHILKRPDTYIGSVERLEKEMWVFNSDADAMERREVSFVPGLYKIFDEVLVNAADNKQRDKNMDEIRVTIDRQKGEISVKNNGRGIPIEVHAKEGIYIPEMIFGHLLTSSNYDDEEQKVTGGRNGFGAKLCNIYSTQFVIETQDARSKKLYKQVWTDNMSKMRPARITAAKGDDFTKITFIPDFEKFGMNGMDGDFEALVKRRVYDMAGTCKEVKVYLNGERIKVRNFKKYMEMYTKAIKTENVAKNEEGPAEANDTQVILTDTPNERWEIGFAVSDGSFQQVSFVNSIATMSGGTHVNYVADQIVNKLMDIVKKRNKGGVALKNNQIRNYIFLFVNCLIVNPAFTSQTKEQLTTKASQFGSKCTVSEKFLKDIAKTEAVNNILHFAQKKADQVLKKSDGNRRTRMNNSKLTDANKAGTKDGHRCTLILTEGDSASLLALAGRAVLDPDLIGVFPLRGKLLNVRDASIDMISKNQEIQNIKKFMGLQHKKQYEDTKSLRYGHLMIMTDQDHDGSHIKGLLINFIECSFPSLLKIPGFLKVFITPIVKVWKGDPKNPKKLQQFFTMPEYESWKEIPGNERGWDHKYFKGLGTSSPSDAEIYFRDLDRHLKEFQTLKLHEPELIDLAFSKKKADARKEWLRQFRPGTYLDMSAGDIAYDDFINRELILFSMADNQRSIPSVIDGFKPGQRKVLYTCFRKHLKKDIKVVELSGLVSGLTAYAYGDASLQQTIVGLAQNFVGSNNINCLEPSGNFGSRLQGGSDCASARYIYTRLSPFARCIFHATDEPLLTYHLDDGKTIEPEFYMPILPMILINGADGIGTGWSTSIPNYKPDDVVENLLLRMAGASKEDMKPMKPWFRGWQGEVEDLGGDRYKFTGTIRQTDENEVEITELPVRMWTQDFKDKLEEIIKAEKTPSFIKDYAEYNTPIKVHFIIKIEDKHMKIAMEKGLEDTFKLSKTVATSNFVAFDGQGRIHKYATVLDIMEEFYHIRLKYYEERKKYMLSEMQKELEKWNNQSRFIKMIIDGELVVSRKKKKIIVAELRQKGFKPFPKVVDTRKEGQNDPVAEDENGDDLGDDDTQTGASDYDYLLGMAIWSLTQERIDKLAKQIHDKETEIDSLIMTSPKQIWEKDLTEFMDEWQFQLKDEAHRAKKLAGMGRRTSAKLRIKGTGLGRKRKLDGSDADSDFAVSKPKEAYAGKPRPKASDMFDFLTRKSPEEQSSRPMVNSIEQKPVVRPPPIDSAMQIDGTTDSVSEEDVGAALIFKSVQAKARKNTSAVQKRMRKPAAKASTRNDEGYEHVDDVFMDIAGESTNSVAPPARRQVRAAASKAKTYAQFDESNSSDDNGDDLLGDVSKMVKGISNGGREASTEQPAMTTLFTTSTSRPSSSHGPGRKTITSMTTKPAVKQSQSEDETDYKKLVPRDSPQKLAARSARDNVVSDDDDSSLDPGAPRFSRKPSTKTTTKPPATSAAAPQPSEDLEGRPKNPAKPKSAGTVNEKKPLILSPAAKAYAAKQAKAKTGASAPVRGPVLKPALRPAKKMQTLDSDIDDFDKLADDLLSDDDNGKGAFARPAARPLRRAAVKSKYLVDIDSDAEENEEDDYEDDNSD